MLFEPSFRTIMLEPVIVKALEALPPVRNRHLTSVLDVSNSFLSASNAAVCDVVLYGTSAVVVAAEAAAVVMYGESAALIAEFIAIVEEYAVRISDI